MQYTETLFISQRRIAKSTASSAFILNKYECQVPVRWRYY